MASLSVDGFDRLAEGMERISDIPGDVKLNALRLGGEVVEFHTLKMGMAYGVHRTGTTLGSAHITNEQITGDGGSVDITFKGSNSDGNRNAEVAFVNNFGVTRTNRSQRAQGARPFIDDATQSSAEEASDAAGDVLLDWIESNL